MASSVRPQQPQYQGSHIILVNHNNEKYEQSLICSPTMSQALPKTHELVGPSVEMRLPLLSVVEARLMTHRRFFTGRTRLRNCQQAGLTAANLR